MGNKESLQGQIDSMRNRINHLNSEIINLHARINSEISIARATFRDIDTLKEMHQIESGHLRHEHTKDDLHHFATAEEHIQDL